MQDLIDIVNDTTRPELERWDALAELGELTIWRSEMAEGVLNTTNELDDPILGCDLAYALNTAWHAGNTAPLTRLYGVA